MTSAARTNAPLSPLVSRFARDRAVATLLPWFISGLKPSIENLGIATEAGDWHRVAALAHRLKGEAATYGYPDLARAASSLEDMAKTRHGDCIISSEELMMSLRDLIARARSGLAE